MLTSGTHLSLFPAHLFWEVPVAAALHEEPALQAETEVSTWHGSCRQGEEAKGVTQKKAPGCNLG